MSSFAAVLNLSSKRSGDIGSFDVLDCRFRIDRSISTNGQPVTELRAAIIKLQIIASENAILIGSLFDTTDQVKGSIEFKDADGGKTFKTLKFDAGYIIKYAELFNAFSNDPMIVKFNISAGTVELDGTSHSYEWAK